MPWALPQAVRFAIFLAMAIAMSYLKPDALQASASSSLMPASILLLLILVEAIGLVGGGAQRWLDLGLIRLQPSELMKPVIVLVLARFYAARAAARDQALVGDLAGGAAGRLPGRCSS